MSSAWQQLTQTLEARFTPAPMVVAVSKTQPASRIADLYRAGCRDFGENYVQEWGSKRSELASSCPDIHWHFIGRLQSNKLANIVGHAHLIHSLDSLSHLKKINDVAQQKNLIQQVLVQLNVAEEESKAGLSADALPSFLKEASNYAHVRITGLMTFPAPVSDVEHARPWFRTLRELRDRANTDCWYPHPLTELSMGTSGDFMVAAHEGATLLRLGTVVFGERA